MVISGSLSTVAVPVEGDLVSGFDGTIQYSGTSTSFEAIQYGFIYGIHSFSGREAVNRMCSESRKVMPRL